MCVAVGAPLVDSVLSGINAYCIAYGQSGTGKTFTMEGSHGPSSTGTLRPASGMSGTSARRAQPPAQAQQGSILRGLAPRSLEKLFQDISNSKVPLRAVPVPSLSLPFMRIPTCETLAWQTLAQCSKIFLWRQILFPFCHC
jgi:hypothetical protein